MFINKLHHILCLYGRERTVYVMNAVIINPDNLPESFIHSEIEQVEAERGRTVAKAEFHRISETEASERFWWVPDTPHYRLSCRNNGAL